MFTLLKRMCHERPRALRQWGYEPKLRHALPPCPGVRIRSASFPMPLTEYKTARAMARQAWLLVAYNLSSYSEMGGIVSFRPLRLRMLHTRSCMLPGDKGSAVIISQ